MPIDINHLLIGFTVAKLLKIRNQFFFSYLEYIQQSVVQGIAR